MKPAIPYYRVSTDRQGKSGLGLEAQKLSVELFAKASGFQLLQEFTEVESGRKNNRPVLKQALAACKKQQAVLLIAKLDRLARDVIFILTLYKSKAKFIAVDDPAMDKLSVQMKAVFAEHERDIISIRTKNALQAAKLRGVELGKNGKYVLSKQNKEASLAFAKKMQPVIVRLRKKGFKTVRQITAELNRLKVPTYRGEGKQWHIATVHKILKSMNSA